MPESIRQAYPPSTAGISEELLPVMFPALWILDLGLEEGKEGFVERDLAALDALPGAIG
jgi:hypothetical protein